MTLEEWMRLLIEYRQEEGHTEPVQPSANGCEYENPNRFTAYSQNTVYFGAEYDGQPYIDSVPRHPKEIT